MMMSRFLTRKAEEALQTFYKREGGGPVEPLAIAGTPMHLVTIEKLQELRGIAMALGSIESPDGFTYAVVTLPKNDRSPARGE